MVKQTPSLTGARPGQDAKLEALVEDALQSGVTAAVVIATGDIIVDQKLSDMCRYPRCEGYGLSKSCPPYVAGPAGFRELLAKFSQAIFFEIHVPSELIFSSQRREVFELLHQLAVGIEQRAVTMGFPGARAYAGGSCKQIFCHEKLECRVISGGGQCRHPKEARPSMSGFGIDVAKLAKRAGWKERLSAARDGAGKTAKMAPLYGLVLVC